jgi:hypothetical protein
VGSGLAFDVEEPNKVDIFSRRQGDPEVTSVEGRPVEVISRGGGASRVLERSKENQVNLDQHRRQVL